MVLFQTLFFNIELTTSSKLQKTSPLIFIIIFQDFFQPYEYFFVLFIILTIIQKFIHLNPKKIENYFQSSHFLKGYYWAPFRYIKPKDFSEFSQRSQIGLHISKAACFKPNKPLLNAQHTILYSPLLLKFVLHFLLARK